MRTWTILGCFLGLSLGLAAQKPYAPYGGVFTPRGDLKALVVLVEFKPEQKLNPQFNNGEDLRGWPKGATLPEALDVQTGAMPELFYRDGREFEAIETWSRNQYSQYFYRCSKGQFRFMAEVFKDSLDKPLVVQIEAEGAREWTYLNRQVWREMLRLNPNFDFKAFDQRQNNPQYRFDNSLSAPDGLIDYLIIMYRYSPQWASQPAPGMKGWAGSGGGFAGIGSFLAEAPAADGTRVQDGFTAMYASGVFIHEIAHSLFNAPHLFGVNRVLGDYFSSSVGWGATAGNTMFEGMNAWERWYCGFIEAQSLHYDSSTWAKTWDYVLEDFNSTGDALRIELPFSEGQYLWLENHAGLDAWDKHSLVGQMLDGRALPDNAPGVYAYVEAIAPRRDSLIQALSPAANGLKLLHAAGHYDYEWLPDSLPRRGTWGQTQYYFRRLAESPIFGLNPQSYLIVQGKEEVEQKVSTNYNAGQGNRVEQIALQEVRVGEWAVLHHFLGGWDAEWAFYQGPGGFRPGQSLSMSSNPLPLAYTRFDYQRDAQRATKLNGLQVEFLPSHPTDPPHSRRIRVAYGQTRLTESRRWAGPLILPNISCDAKADLIIGRGKSLRLGQDRQAQKRRGGASRDFRGLSYLEIQADASLALDAHARLFVEPGAVLRLQPGASLYLGRRARLEGRVEGLDKAKIFKHPKAKIRTE